MPPSVTSTQVRFVVRRAFRIGRVTRGDVSEAFELKAVRASAVLSHAAAGDYGLRRQPRWIDVQPWAHPPAWANALELMASLDRGEHAFAVTGLRAEELPVHYVHWTAIAPRSAEAMELLVQSIVKTVPCRIRYCGLRRAEQARWRRIVPLGLERMADQWRVIAHDLEDAAFALRTFVLARISDACEDRDPLPKRFTPANSMDVIDTVRVALDGRLTPDQRASLEHELKIRDGRIQLPRRTVFEYRRRFSAAATSADALWPPIKSLTTDAP